MAKPPEGPALQFEEREKQAAWLKDRPREVSVAGGKGGVAGRPLAVHAAPSGASEKRRRRFLN